MNRLKNPQTDKSAWFTSFLKTAEFRSFKISWWWLRIQDILRYRIKIFTTTRFWTTWNSVLTLFWFIKSPTTIWSEKIFRTSIRFLRTLSVLNLYVWISRFLSEKEFRWNRFYCRKKLCKNLCSGDISFDKWRNVMMQIFSLRLNKKQFSEIQRATHKKKAILLIAHPQPAG